MQAPVVIQTTPSTLRYAGAKLYHAIVAALANDVTVPIALHLDHGNSFEMAVNAIRDGYTSVMIDGSRLSFEDNIEISKRVVRFASKNGIPVEAELGALGGKEDDLINEDDLLTDPLMVRKFVTRTKISSLAVAIGTAHGIYKSVPELDLSRLKEIRSRVNIPLVLHGASGLSDHDLISCIHEGICKVNFATDLRIAFSDGIKNVLQEDPATFDPKIYGKVASERVKKLVKNRMTVCGCVNRY
jgi:tagatose 1,6-diphosphate aldolase GatY/KbaY